MPRRPGHIVPASSLRASSHAADLVSVLVQIRYRFFDTRVVKDDLDDLCDVFESGYRTEHVIPV